MLQRSEGRSRGLGKECATLEIEEKDFNVIAVHLQATLEELESGKRIDRKDHGDRSYHQRRHRQSSETERKIAKTHVSGPRSQPPRGEYTFAPVRRTLSQITDSLELTEISDRNVLTCKFETKERDVPLSYVDQTIY